MARLHRYWIEFKAPQTKSETEITGVWWLLGYGEGRFGCGVSAYTLDDALWIVQQDVFGGEPLPELEQITEDIDVSTLEAFNNPHFQNNFGVPVWRGVWFPKYFESTTKTR